MGKTTLLLNMATDDVYKGYGLCLIEPHGDACLRLLQAIPEHRKADVIYFDATNTAQPTGFNPLHGVPVNQRSLVASELILAFKKIWGDSWGPRLEYILRYCLLTLLEYPTATLLDIHPLLLDKAYRNLVLQFIENEAIKQFWYYEYDSYTTSFRNEAIAPILNKIGVFNANTILRNIIGQQESISMDDIMNTGQILICNLAKGIVGEDVSQILGSLITASIQTVAMRRAAIPESDRQPFFCYIDECQSFITTSLTAMLSEVRKYKVGLFLTHQYLGQLPEDVRGGIIGNAGTIICFRLGANDAKTMAEEFYPTIKQANFISLQRFSFYLTLLIEGVTSTAFSAVLLRKD